MTTYKVTYRTPGSQSRSLQIEAAGIYTDQHGNLIAEHSGGHQSTDVILYMSKDIWWSVVEIKGSSKE